MIKALITDFSKVLLFPKDTSYTGSLNGLHKELSTKPDYTLLDIFELNSELLDYYRSLTGRIDLYIFTSESIQDAPELQPFLHIFKEVFSAMRMGISKTDIGAYRKLATTINVDPMEIVFIDDSEMNIVAARNAGFQTILYKNNQSLKVELQALLL